MLLSVLSLERKSFPESSASSCTNTKCSAEEPRPGKNKRICESYPSSNPFIGPGSDTSCPESAIPDFQLSPQASVLLLHRLSSFHSQLTGLSFLPPPVFRRQKLLSPPPGPAQGQANQHPNPILQSSLCHLQAIPLFWPPYNLSLEPLNLSRPSLFLKRRENPKHFSSTSHCLRGKFPINVTCNFCIHFLTCHPLPTMVRTLAFTSTTSVNNCSCSGHHRLPSPHLTSPSCGIWHDLLPFLLSDNFPLWASPTMISL